MGAAEINTLGRMMRASRSNMVEMESTAHAEMFFNAFGMRDGDYVEVRRRNHNKWMPARIVFVSDCYVNARGGYTARVKVAQLLATGGIGTGRDVLMTIRQAGKKSSIVGIGSSEVRRPEIARFV